MAIRSHADMVVMGAEDDDFLLLVGVGAREEADDVAVLLHVFLGREGKLGADNAARFVPVRLIEPPHDTPSPVRRTVSDKSSAAGIEISLPDGTRLYIRREAQLPLLRPVIEALRR